MVSTAELYLISHSLAMKNNGGFPSPDEWNKYANMAATDLFNYYLGSVKNLLKEPKLVSPVAPGVNENVDNALLPFKVNQLSIAVVSGKATYPIQDITEHIISVMATYNGGLVKVNRIVDNKLPTLLSSTIDAPTTRYPAFNELNDGLLIFPQLSPILLTFYQTPTPVKWAYLISGSILTLSTLVAGTTYTNGTYTNVPLTGGTGRAAQATVVVAGAIVTSVTITNSGIGYIIGDILSASPANIGGTGSGFSINVATISNASRIVFDPTLTIDFQFQPSDKLNLLMRILEYLGVSVRDGELMQYAEQKEQTVS